MTCKSARGNFLIISNTLLEIYAFFKIRDVFLVIQCDIKICITHTAGVTSGLETILPSTKFNCVH